MEETDVKEIIEKQPENEDAKREEDKPIIIEKAKPKRKPKGPIEKVECLKCHKMIRKYDLKRHETMYCNGKEQAEKKVTEKKVQKQEQPQEEPINNNNNNNSPDNNELLMKLLEHINSKSKDNKQERYKNMMSKYYRF